MIIYTGLTKAEVLAALWNASHVQGLGILQADPKHTVMTTDEAQNIIDRRKGNLYFDYFEGRVLKIDLSSDNNAFDERLYDRDCGTNAAIKAINKVKSKKGLI